MILHELSSCYISRRFILTLRAVQQYSDIIEAHSNAVGR